MFYKNFRNGRKAVYNEIGSNLKPISYRLDIAALNGANVKCNLNCSYCHKDYFTISKPYNENFKLSYVEIIKMLDQVIGKNSRPRKIHLSGRAEPLVVEKEVLISEIKNLSENFPNYDMAMTTNGILLDNFAEDLIAAGLKRFNVSMHNKINPQSKIVKGMQKAVLVGGKVAMNVMISKPTLDNLHELLDFAAENQFKLKLFYELGIEENLMIKQLLTAIEQVSILTNSYGKTDKIKNRMVFNFQNTTIEIKLLEKLSTRPENCSVCKYNSICKEGCWESIRITPWYIKPCGVKEENVYLFEENSLEQLRKKLIEGSKLEQRVRINKIKKGVA